MIYRLPDITPENAALTQKLEQMHIEFLDLFTSHKDMVENESDILTSVYLEKLGRFQLELLKKQTEASRLKMKMNFIQAAINRNENPNLKAIDKEIDKRLDNYYQQIASQSAAIDDANKVLSLLISEEETKKLKEIFRVLCKKLHPDLNPNQTENERDLFVKVKAAYELQRLGDLQNILLYLDESCKENLTSVLKHDKEERIKHLENQVKNLRDKIEKLKQSFPFNIRELIFDDDYIRQKQEELRIQIKTAEEEADKYLNFIKIMIDE